MKNRSTSSGSSTWLLVPVLLGGCALPTGEAPLTYVCEPQGEVVRQPLAQREATVGMPCPLSTDRTVDCDGDARASAVPIVVVDCEPPPDDAADG